MSTSTTSPSSFAAAQWAAVAPTNPAPTTVILLRAMVFLPFVLDVEKRSTPAGCGILAPAPDFSNAKKLESR
ncbi:hypothetical protein JCM30394_11820 [Deferrisoma palaeochoriense]